MKPSSERLLPPFLIFAGMICLGAYPLHVVWPSGWEWGMEGRHYLHMILVVYATLGVFLISAARNPPEHRSLLMAGQAIQMNMPGHLSGDVAAMIVLGVGLLVMMPKRSVVTSQ